MDDEITAALKKKPVLSQLLYWEPFSYYMMFVIARIGKPSTFKELVDEARKSITEKNLIFDVGKVETKVSRAIDTLLETCLIRSDWRETDDGGKVTFDRVYMEDG